MESFRNVLNPRESKESWSSRRYRLASRRLGGLKHVEEPDFRENEAAKQFLFDDDKPSVVRVLGNVRTLRKAVKSQKPGTQDEVDKKRTFGMGLVGELSQREMDADVANVPHIRELLDDWTDYRPYFSYWISFVQLMVTIFAVISTGLGPLGVGLSHESGLVLTEFLTFEQIDVFQPSNFWIGPPAKDLVRLGAAFAPCMRNDVTVMSKVNQELQREKNESGCCVRNDMSGCVQTYRENCSPLLSIFLKWTEENPGPDGRTSGPVCGLDPHFCDNPASNGPFTWANDISDWPLCRKSSRRVEQGIPKHMSCKQVSRPCCIGIHGKCELRSKEYCDFVKGAFHPEASLCSQVHCMSDVCGMLPFVRTDTPDQFYRLWTSLFLNAGLIHTTISITFQMIFVRDLEKMCGCMRVALIYFSSGIMGNLASLLFTPYRPECGPSGALFGILGTMVTEVIRAWPLLLHPWRALGQIFGIVLLLFICGLLPWVDNYAHIAGFFTGLSISYAILPQVSVSTGEIRTKVSRILRIILPVSVTVAFVIMILIFYLFSLTEECEWCKLFSCIPFTRDFCAELSINYERKQRLF